MVGAIKYVGAVSEGYIEERMLRCAQWRVLCCTP